MGWRPKNYIESVLPLITVYAMVGHEVFRYPASKPRFRLSVCYTILMLIANLTLQYLAVVHAFAFNYDTIEEKLFPFICGLNTIIVLCTGSLSWYHCKRRNLIVERITAVDETLTELGADCQHSKTFRSSIACLVIQLLLIVVLNSLDSLWVVDKFTAFEIFWLVGVMHHPYYISNYGLMKCSMTMSAVGVRFRITNKILGDILKENGRRDERGNPTVSRRLTQVEQICAASRQNIEKQTVQIIKQVHLELCGITRGLNAIFGIQIVLQLAAYFAFFTILGYDLYVIYKNPTFMERTRRMCSLSFWFLVHLMKILILNHMSASVTSEAYKTREIIQELNMMNDNQDFKDELRQFSLQMLENTLTFAPMGFFSLGYGLVSSMLGTVATYLVILVQTNIVPEFMLVNSK